MAAKKKSVRKKKAAAPKRSATKPKNTGAWSGHPLMPTRPQNEPTLAKLRKLCLALPDASENINHGRPCFVVNDKTFVMFLDNHHDDGRVAIWCKAPPGAQTLIVEGDPDRYFVPPYVGPRGWIGARLDRKPDWAAIGALVGESYAMTAPKRKRHEA